MTVSPTANNLFTRPSLAAVLQAVLAVESVRRPAVAVGETVMLLTPLSFSVETTTEWRGGCSGMAELSPTATILAVAALTIVAFRLSKAVFAEQALAPTDAWPLTRLPLDGPQQIEQAAADVYAVDH